jgi:glycosyltransferase involved in cell wall biosynthesis
VFVRGISRFALTSVEFAYGMLPPGPILLLRLNSKQNLVFIATRVPFPAVTGHYLRTLNILKGLTEHFNVFFFGFHDKNGASAAFAAAERAMRAICEEVHIEHVGAERSGIRLAWDLFSSALTLRPFVAAKYRSASMHRAIRATLESRDIAVVHADSLPSGQYLTGIAEPKLLTNHNIEYVRLLSYASIQRSWVRKLAFRIQAVLTKRYERALLLVAGNCVVVSEVDGKALAQLAPEIRFFLVKNGTDTSHPPLPPPPRTTHTALWVGGMNDVYNREAVNYFASAILPLIRARVPQFRWRVVGRDPPKLLVELAADPDSGVELAGFVEDLRNEYAAAALVVVPLTSGGGTKLKVLEAMAMGRAVVTTPIGAEGIAVHDGVDMEIADSAEDFSLKTARLLLDPQHAAHMATAARALAEQSYDWRAVNRDMHDAIRHVVDSAATQEQSARCAG